MPSKQQRTPQRASTMIDQLRARTLAPVPDIAPGSAAPVVEPEAAPAQPGAAMPAEQPSQQRKTRTTTTGSGGKTAAADGGEWKGFEVRITQTLSKSHARKLRQIMTEQNDRLDDAGHEQVYTVTGLIRAAVDVCLSDPKLTVRMIKAASEPRLSGRGGIGTRR